MLYRTSGSLLLLAASAHALFPDCSNGPELLKSNAVCNTSLSVIARAQAIIGAMTLAEKINNTGSTSPGVERLGLPPYTWWNEALHGVASSPGVNFSDMGNFSHATSFPQPILMGAAFDDALIESVASVVSTEGRAFNNANRSGADFWTPNINPYKDPRWGRGQETPGEDPFHLSSYVNSLITGLQGGKNPAVTKVISTCKHVAAYDLESWMGNYRYQFNAEVTTQDMVEYYLPTFKQCADSNVQAMMCSYNAINGVPSCANDYLLNTILREHWGFKGDGQWITSDCDAVENVFGTHDFTDSRAVTVAESLKAGTDINCGQYYQLFLTDAHSQGLVTESDIDKSLIRQYSSLIKLGFFNPPSDTPYRSLTWKDVSTPSSQKLAYTAAVEGITMIKNDGTLPLAIKPGMSVAIIGDWANATTQMQGNYQGVAPYLRSPLYALQQIPNITVNYGNGPTQGNPTTDDWQSPLAAARKSDVIIYAGGVDIDVEAEGMDRYTIKWLGFQTDLINLVCGMGKPCVLIQMGDQLDNSPFLNNPNVSAILWGGYPGQDGGTALVDIVTGKQAPAGRLPVTQYPTNYVNEVPMTDMNLRPGKNNPGRTYKWYNGTAVVPFGYGLHYTNFSTSITPPSKTSYDIQILVAGCSSAYPSTVTPNLLPSCPFANISVPVKNTGKVASDFVTLGFLTGTYGPKPYPNKQLVTYTRLHNIAGGASQTATLPLTLQSLSRVDVNGDTVLYPGDYEMLVDVPTQSTLKFTLTGKAATLDKWPQPPKEGMAARNARGQREGWF
ncbi:hypothetical protein MMC25_004758 [Agyrium rufum]|nr:hypothetical protein [Agyrium rufum]